MSSPPSKSGKALGLAEGDLVTKLRAVAGDVDGATKFSEAHQSSGRMMGTP